MIILAVAAAGCGFGGDNTSSNANSGSSSGSSRRAIRTVDEPYEIFPLTFLDKPELLDFAVNAYDSYWETASQPGRLPPEFDIDSIEQIADSEAMETKLLNGVCLGIGERPTADELERGILSDINDGIRSPEERQEIRVLVWVALALQYDIEEVPDPADYPLGEVPEHVPEYRTICNQKP